jgi:endonuclease/exonuclease/phosphatase family metal-dependent hydrolase
LEPGIMAVHLAFNAALAWLEILAGLAGVAAVYGALVVLANRFAVSQSRPLRIEGGGSLPDAGVRLKVATWNVGYAGLGAASDFVADGGRHYRAPSRVAVLDNLAGIVDQLVKMDAEVFLLQEIAKGSPLNHGVDVLAGLRSCFSGFAWVFDYDVRSRLLPPPLQVAHGTGIFSSRRLEAAEKKLLKFESNFHAGLVRKEYRMQIVRLPIEARATDWVVVNIHLAAFDKDATVRREQLRQIIAYAVAEYENGHHVIVGGDWNMEFVSEPFHHQTAQKHRFWLHDFDYDSLPTGWQAVFDPEIASVRTLHQPYRAGVNYTAIIDGFIISPNVVAEEVHCINLDFAHADHHPVQAVFAIASRNG